VVARRKCSYCGARIEPGTGLMFVKNDGTILWFCSSKCFKLFKMGRDPKRLPWTEHYARTRRGR